MFPDTAIAAAPFVDAMLTAGDVLPEETEIAFPEEPVAIVTDTPAVVLSALPRVLLTVIPSPRPFCVTATAAEPTDVKFVGLLLTLMDEPSVEFVTLIPVALAVAPGFDGVTFNAVPEIPP